MGPVWPPCGHARSPLHRVGAVGCSQSPVPRLADIGVWPVPWAPSGCHGGMAVFLDTVWMLRGCGQSLRIRLGAMGRWLVRWTRLVGVGAWSFPWAPGGALQALPLSSATSRGHGGIPGPLCHVWLPWGVAGPLHPVWWPWGRVRSPGTRLAAVMLWPVPWDPSRRHGGMAVPWSPSSRRGG